MKPAARSLASLVALALATLAPSTRADPPPPVGDAVPDPGRGIASVDDDGAMVVNPGGLPLMPDPELRWTWVRTGDASPLPSRGHSIALGLPFWVLATGLRVDLLDPPTAAPGPWDDSSTWVRWSLGMRGGDTFGMGTTFGWSASDALALDGAFSITSGMTMRPWSTFALGFVARNWNEPLSASRTHTFARSWEAGFAVRPTGRRAVEVGVETAYFDGADEWVPRVTAGLDVPRVGRLRGDLAVQRTSTTPEVVAMAGLDLNAGMLQLSGGGVFGSAVGNSGTGFYLGAAVRGYREPGVRLPTHVARIKIDSVPGVRGHVRLLRRLWRLGDDPEVSGVVLVVRDEPASSLAHAEELGEAIRGLRAKGKKVLCHLEDAGGRALYVCSQADRIAMNPAGGLRFAGLSSRYFFFGGLLKKLGVRADFVRIGAHKLAAEQFTRSESSDVGREDHKDLVDQFTQVYLHDVGGGRRIPSAELGRRLAKGPFLASEARAQGLIDVLAYDDEIERVVEELVGPGARIVDDEAPSNAPDRWTASGKIALVYLAGDMVDGDSQNIPVVGVRLAGSRTISKALKRAREDRSVKAVVFRIETGGGSSLAADVILREAILTAKAKPLIVSMGSAAASGGYYVSVAGKPIFANRSTVTGSIGIFYGKVDVVDLLDKLGVHVEHVRAAPRADAESLFRPFTDDEHRELGVKVKQFYDTFIARVSEGRKMSPDAVDAIARGRVWSGAQAQARGLVDRIGGLRAALAEARRVGDLPNDAPIVELPDDDESLLGLLVKLAGLSSIGIQGSLPSVLVPPGMMEIARGLAPFFVFEPHTPLARMEMVGDPSFEVGEATSSARPWVEHAPTEP